MATEYPFVLERRLRDRKARFEESPMKMVRVSRDGRLVTGQNPFSTPRAVDEVIRALGRAPLSRQPDRDARCTCGAIEKKIADQKNGRLASVRRAVTLLELGGRYFSHPRVQSALARAQIRLGDRDKARATLLAAAEKFPQSAAISKMLEELDGTIEP